MRRETLALYLVTDREMCKDYGLVETVCDAIDGGVTFVQLRDKESSDDELYRIACELNDAVAGRVPLVINDRVAVAKKANLDGAHIGQSDLPVAEAREVLGPDAILGLSVGTHGQLIQAQTQFADAVDYVGFSPVFSTSTKPDHDPPTGLDGLRYLVEESVLPGVAIGGINVSNAGQVYATGVAGIAVVSAICAAANPREAAKQLFECYHQ